MGALDMRKSRFGDVYVGKRPELDARHFDLKQAHGKTTIVSLVLTQPFAAQGDMWSCEIHVYDSGVDKMSLLTFRESIKRSS